MRSIVVLVAVAAACAVLVVLRLPEDASAGTTPAVRSQELQSIAIDGGRGLPLAALRARIASKVGELVDAQRLDRDRVALEAELEARGYLAAKVAKPSITFGARGGASVVFDVELGPMFHVRSIVVTGLASRDAGLVTLLGGDDASRDRIEQARQNLVATLERFAAEPRGGRGHRPQVDLVLHTDVPAAALDVELVAR